MQQKKAVQFAANHHPNEDEASLYVIVSREADRGSKDEIRGLMVSKVRNL